METKLKNELISRLSAYYGIKLFELISLRAALPIQTIQFWLQTDGVCDNAIEKSAIDLYEEALEREAEKRNTQ